jgi:hypothetical protein
LLCRYARALPTIDICRFHQRLGNARDRGISNPKQIMEHLLAEVDFHIRLGQVRRLEIDSSRHNICRDCRRMRNRAKANR